MSTATLRFSAFALSMLMFFIACDTQVVRRNDPTDVVQAREAGGRFYQLIAANELDSASTLFGPSVGKEDGAKLIESTATMRGHLVDAIPYLIETIVTIENGQVRQVVCNYKVAAVYSEGKTEELVNMKGATFGTMKIVGYEIALK